MQIVGIITIKGDRGFGQFQKRRVPSGDPNGRSQSHRSSGIGDIKDSGEGITHGANQQLSCSGSIYGGREKCRDWTRGTRRISKVRYAVCKLATKSARRPKGLDESEVRDELSSFKMGSSGGGSVKEPFQAGANEVAYGGAVLVEAGAGRAVEATVG